MFCPISKSKVTKTQKNKILNKQGRKVRHKGVLGGAHNNAHEISGAGERKKKSIMGGWLFKLVILGIFLRTQTCSENNKIAKKMQ